MTRIEEIFLELIKMRNNCSILEDYCAYDDAILALIRVGPIAQKREEALIELQLLGQEADALDEDFLVPVDTYPK